MFLRPVRVERVDDDHDDDHDNDDSQDNSHDDEKKIAVTFLQSARGLNKLNLEPRFADEMIAEKFLSHKGEFGNIFPNFYISCCPQKERSTSLLLTSDGKTRPPWCAGGGSDKLWPLLPCAGGQHSSPQNKQSFVHTAHAT